jgi:ammonium transporter, Amt family
MMPRAARNAELAKQRAMTVRDALLRYGVALAQLKLSKPSETLGGEDAREARRVEMRVQ